MPYEESNKPLQRPHNVIMEERKKLSVSGVENVESFDEAEIVLQTNKGTLTIRGSELHIGKLSVDTGEVNIEGKIGELQYEDEAPVSGGLFGRLFK